MAFRMTAVALAAFVLNVFSTFSTLTCQKFTVLLNFKLSVANKFIIYFVHTYLSFFLYQTQMYINVVKLNDYPLDSLPVLPITISIYRRCNREHVPMCTFILAMHIFIWDVIENNMFQCAPLFWQCIYKINNTYVYLFSSMKIFCQLCINYSWQFGDDIEQNVYSPLRSLWQSIIVYITYSFLPVPPAVVVRH
jgi:hypothetical protein